MIKTVLIKEKGELKFGYKLLPDRRPATSSVPMLLKRLFQEEFEYENVSAVVGFLVLVGTFWLGINVGLFFANLLKQL